MAESLRMIEENETKIRDKALQILYELCDNIIKHPEDAKYRRIRVANPLITEKLLPASGAIECLFEMGFNEDGEYFSMPLNASLTGVHELKKSIQALRQSRMPTKSPTTQSSSLSSSGARPKESQLNFPQMIVNAFNDVLQYENPELQNYTRSFVPISKLQFEAMKKMRALQKSIKTNPENESNQTKDSDVSMEDLVLSELVNWFKNDFFNWVNSPECSLCLNRCNFTRNEYTRNPTISRVEIHKCETCGNEEKFPRYIDPRILLTTRKGRCGEWANAFTLICRSHGYDARIVYDKTDHVWTEIWSIAQNRWLHVDPCENIIDRPLLYEKGWKKKLSYILAYSKDEVQDVTWRYTKDFTSVMKRRKECTEEFLLMFILRLNRERQNSNGYSSARRQFVVKRQLMELIEFLPAPPGAQKACDYTDTDEYGGRISGDMSWRLARGEITIPTRSHVWKVPEGVGTFQLRYYIIKDMYEVRGDGKVLETRENWANGVDTCSGVFRNIENDWKMMYIARVSGLDQGNVSWSVELPEKLVVESLEFRSITKTFNDASVQWTIQCVNNDNSIGAQVVANSAFFQSKDLKKARKISLTANLSGGSGDVAWQHAQLFRQSFNAHSDDISMLISLVTSSPKDN